MFARHPRNASATDSPALGDRAATALSDRVREHFSRGLSAESANALVEARDAGLAWELLTRAVAEGLDQHYYRLSGTPLVQQATARAPRRFGLNQLALQAVLACWRRPPFRTNSPPHRRSR
jgi:hypothetical protein